MQLSINYTNYLYLGKNSRKKNNQKYLIKTRATLNLIRFFVSFYHLEVKNKRSQIHTKIIKKKVLCQIYVFERKGLQCVQNVSYFDYHTLSIISSKM